ATFMARLKRTAVILLTLTALGTGGGVLVYRALPDIHGDAVSRKQPPPLGSISQGNAAQAVQTPQPLLEDKAKLQGTWIIASAEQNGQVIHALNGRRLVFAGDGSFTLSAGREVPGIIPSAPMQGDFTLQPGSPKPIDLSRRRGIYSVNGATLQICLNPPFTD